VRRIWIMLLAVALALVIALPAGAGKPDKPPKRPKPPTSVPIAVSMDAQPVWSHEGRDLIRYGVTLENKTSAAISDVAVMFITSDPDVYEEAISDWDSTEGVDDKGVVPANSSVWMGFYLYVDQFLEAAPCLTEYDPKEPEAWPDVCALLATAEVLIDGNVATQTQMSIPLMPEPPCDFTYEWVGDETSRVWTGTREEPLSGVCIWTPGADWTGIWKVTLAPTEPKNVKRSIDAQVAVRDGIPGNWCTLPDGSGGVFSEQGQWSTDWRVIGEVYLPGTENIRDLAFDPFYGGGTCLAGGAGGDYFMVGNSDSFYLRAEGTVTVEWVEPVELDDTPVDE
jgi:hypothetical protein